MPLARQIAQDRQDGVGMSRHPSAELWAPTSLPRAEAQRSRPVELGDLPTQLSLCNIGRFRKSTFFGPY